MSKKLYEEGDIQAIADAIREKNGGADSYTVAEMAQAVRDIPSGGGDIDGLISGTIVSVDSEAEKVVKYAFFNLTSLVSVNLPNAASVGTSAFNGCTALTSVSLPKAETINMYAFQKCSALASISLPSATSILNSAFQECGKLEYADCGDIKTLPPAAFYSCSSLSALCLRNTKAVCTLSNVNAISGTPIADGAGYIYVPDELVDSYKVATNWSTFAAQIKPLSELNK